MHDEEFASAFSTSKRLGNSSVSNKRTSTQGRYETVPVRTLGTQCLARGSIGFDVDVDEGGASTGIPACGRTRNRHCWYRGWQCF